MSCLSCRNEAFDGLEDLEEEEEEEDVDDLSTIPKDLGHWPQRDFAQERSIIARPIGSGLQMLEDLYGKHRPET